RRRFPEVGYILGLHRPAARDGAVGEWRPPRSPPGCVEDDVLHDASEPAVKGARVGRLEASDRSERIETALLEDVLLLDDPPEPGAEPQADQAENPVPV